MNEVMEKIQKIGIVPVVVLANAKDASPLAGALCRGGLPCAEVTFRTKAAAESIRIMAGEYPDMLVGAGTVLQKEQADRAVDAGAKFIVSPGLNPEIVKYCMEKGVPIIPGICTPSEVEQAIGLGLEIVKFFPAEPAGGIQMIKALAAPYTNMKFMPTGGIHAGNLNSYLDFPKIIACGGSWMVKDEYMKAGAFDTVEQLTKEAVQSMLGFEVTGIAFAPAPAENTDTANTFMKKIFAGIPETSSSGNGKIAIRTNYIDRALDYLNRQGISFNMQTAVYDGSNRMIEICVDCLTCGFTITLMQK